MRLLLTMTLFVVLVSAQAVDGTSDGRPALSDREAPASRAGDPYCGIYAVYATARLLGRPVDFQSLLQPNFVDTPGGSSLTALGRAAEKVGLVSRPLGGLMPSALDGYGGLAILHVRSDLDVTEPRPHACFLS